jgi:hypothetical protein
MQIDSMASGKNKAQTFKIELNGLYPIDKRAGMQDRMNENLIAPCGMNCAICKAFLRQQNPCHGCSNAEQNRPRTRLHCRLRICEKRSGRFCFS